MKQRLTMTCLFLVIAHLVAACSFPSKPVSEPGQMRGKSIHDVIALNPAFSFGEDKSGNKVAYRNIKIELNDQFRQQHKYLETFEALCQANEGTFQLQKIDVKSNDDARSNTSPIRYMTGISTAKFWATNGIYTPDGAQQAYDQNQASQMRDIQRASDLVDSAIKTESVGTFHCLNNKSKRIRWRINQDLHDVTPEPVRTSGNEKTFSYSAHLTQTVILHEPSSVNPAGDDSPVGLSGSAKDLAYPLKGFYIVLEKSADQWRLASIRHYTYQSADRKRIISNAPARMSSSQEILVASEDGFLIVPAYLSNDTKFFAGQYDANRNQCSIDQIHFPASYSVCNSAYGDAPKDPGTSSKGVLLVLGNASNPHGSYYLNQTRTVAFMQDKFQASLESAGVVKAIQTAPANPLRANAAGHAVRDATTVGRGCPDGLAASGVTTKLLKKRDGLIKESVRLSNGREIVLPAYKEYSDSTRSVGDAYCVRTLVDLTTS